MTYPLIDITRPVRLTDYVKRLGFLSNIISSDNFFVSDDNHHTYPLYYEVGNTSKSFTKYGFFYVNQPYPSIENIPEETKMGTVDWTKEIIDLETGGVMRVLCTDLDGETSVVMLNKDRSLRYCKIDGSVWGKQCYGNRKPDSEPPREVLDIWWSGYCDGSNLRVANSCLSTRGIRDLFKQTYTYADYKNKKITVEDV